MAKNQIRVVKRIFESEKVVMRVCDEGSEEMIWFLARRFKTMRVV